MDKEFYLLIVEVNPHPEKQSDHYCGKVRACLGDWLNLEYYGIQFFRRSTGLRKDKKYQVIQGLDNLEDIPIDFINSDLEKCDLTLLNSLNLS